MEGRREEGTENREQRAGNREQRTEIVVSGGVLGIPKRIPKGSSRVSFGFFKDCSRFLDGFFWTLREFSRNSPGIPYGFFQDC